MSLKKNIAFSYSSQVLNTTLGFVISIFITRLLGPEGRGGYSIFTSAVALAGVWLGFSLPSSIIYFVASGKFSAARIFNTMFFFTLITTLALSLGLPLLFHFNLQWLIFPTDFDNFWWQLLFVVQFFLTQLNSVLVALLNSQKIFVPQAIMNVCNTFLGLIIWILLYFDIINIPWRGFGLVIIVVVVLLLPPVIFNFYQLSKKTKVVLVFSFLKPVEIKEIFRFASIVYICNAVQFLSYRMDLWIVDYYHGKAETGIYSLAVNLSQLMWMLPNAMAGVLYTYMSNSTREQALAYLVRYVRFAFYSTFILGFAAFIFFYFSIPLIYGEAFVSSRLMIGLLLIGVAPFSIPIICGNFFAGVSKVKFNLVASMLGFIVCLIFDFILIPAYKGIGASIATVFSYLANTLYCYFVVRTVFKTDLNLSFVLMMREDVKKLWRSLGARFFPAG